MMRFLTLFLTFFLFFFTIAEERLTEKQIPHGEIELLPVIGNRSFWENCMSAAQRKFILAQGEQALKKKWMLPGETLYSEYSRNGNRSNYERAYGDYLRTVYLLALCACLSVEKAFAAKLETLIVPLCEHPSWLLPAHDTALKNWEKEVVTVDLVSSEVGWNLALCRQIFRSVFAQETIALLDRELERRIVAPFERMIEGKQSPYWLYAKNNWSIVCLTNVCGTLLAADVAPKRRKKLLGEVIRHSMHYLEGIAPDGYCSEGITYWGYGFGHYLILSRILHKASAGNINLMVRPQAVSASAYPEKIRISDSLIPAFSDSELGSKLPRRWLGLRDYLMGRHSSYWKSLVVYKASLSEAAVFLGLPHSDSVKSADTGRIPAFSEFPDAGIFVLRPLPGTKTRLAAAVKGGSNDEFHNHNDVGSYVLAVDGNVPVTVDPGAEHYDGRSFSARRYESRLNNSFGHSVPRINGQLQIAGKDTDSKVLKKHLSDTDVEIVFDIRKAYRQIDSIRKLERTFRYSRIGSGTFEVADTVSLSEPGTFETAVITFGTWKQTAPDRLLLTCRGKNVAVTVDTGGNPFRVSSEEIRENIRWKENPHRIAITLAEPVKEARIRLTFRIPEEA